jgi:Histidine kinase/GAF domain
VSGAAEAGNRRLSCSPQWRRSWRGAWVCTTRRCSATSPTARLHCLQPATNPSSTRCPIGKRFSFEGDNIAAMVYDTGLTARMDSHDNATGLAAKYIRKAGIRSSVGAPIIVDGRLWGVAIVGSSRPEPLPSDTEARVGDFGDLFATAIANAHTHSELTASRVRIVAAADDARRRIERDLHDGAQQRLVSLGLELRIAETRVPAQLNPLKEQISHLVTRVAEISTELQELSGGIHPAILSRGRTESSAQDAGPPLRDPRRTGPRARQTVAGLCRRGGVLRCRRSPYECRQTRASDCSQGVRRR